MSSRKICITAADGQTGQLTAELLLTNKQFSSKFKSLSLLAVNPDKCIELSRIGRGRVNVFPLTFEKQKLLETLKTEMCDTIFLIPPADKEKLAIVKTIIDCAAHLKTVQNVVLLSSAGCDVAERDHQPSIRQFIDMEALVMNAKAEPGMGSTGHSPCIIR